MCRIDDDTISILNILAKVVGGIAITKHMKSISTTCITSEHVLKVQKVVNAVVTKHPLNVSMWVWVGDYVEIKY